MHTRFVVLKIARIHDFRDEHTVHNESILRKQLVANQGGVGHPSRTLTGHGRRLCACYNSTHWNEMLDAVHWLQSAWPLSFGQANQWTKHISGKAMWQDTEQN